MRVTLKLFPKTESGANTFGPDPDDPMYPTKPENRKKTQAPVAVAPHKVGTHTPVAKPTKYPKTTNVGSD